MAGPGAPRGALWAERDSVREAGPEAWEGAGSPAREKGGGRSAHCSGPRAGAWVSGFWGAPHSVDFCSQR